MGVAEQLGLDETSELLVTAGGRWERWVELQPRLAAAGDVARLRDWLQEADPAAADEVLHALATLAAADGGDDVAAATVLAWALLPGACALAHRLRTCSERIDEIVAAQLWVEVRTFPWRRLTRVAANVLMNTRAGVLRECGVASQVTRADRTWSNTSPVDPSGPFWRTCAVAEPPVTVAEELLDVLEWARENDVITEQDRALLLCLVEAAHQAEVTRFGRGAGGLMANAVSQAVAEQWGISPVTVRRRVRRSLRALAASCPGAGVRASA